MSDRITWDVLKGFDLDHSIKKLEGEQEKFKSEMEGILKTIKLLETSPIQENIVTLIEIIMKINISHGEENINLLEILNALKKGIESMENKIEDLNDRIDKI
jgi:predicted RNase H-like nuclease (RuvC/YqgF family)